MKPFDPLGNFQHTPPRDALRRTAIRGAAITVVSQGTGFVIQMAGTLILARLLTPTDFGLMAMVTTFSLLPLNFGVNGFTEAIVQLERLDRQLASNLFWINVAAGAVLSLAFAGCGPLLATVYREPLVAGIATAMAATILLTSTSVVHLALLQRDMRFLAVSANDVVARLLGVATSLALALRGWGYWALVGGAVVLPISQALGGFLLCRWLPRLPGKSPATRSAVSFAMQTYGSFAAGYGSRNLDNLLVGWFFGPHALGIYKKAYDLSVLPNSQLAQPMQFVAVPTLSRLATDPPRHRRYVLGAFSSIAFMGMAVSAALALTGADLILILLGAQWKESGRIFTFFAPGIAARLLCISTSFVHLSIGRADRLFWWGLIELATISAMFVLGLPFGPVGIASAWTLSSWLLLVPAVWYAGRPVALSARAALEVVWRYILGSALAALVTAVTMHRLPELAAAPGMGGAGLRVLVTCVLFGALYLAAVVLLYGSFRPVRQLVQLWRELTARRSPDQEQAASPTAPVVQVPGRMAGATHVTTGTMPLVSILMPAYNAEPWIREAITSALEQTWQRKEVIVVDDGSRDRTLQIAREFASAGVTVVTQANQGAAAARNRAFQLSRGDWIQWLDADDALAPGKVEKQIAAIGPSDGTRVLLSCGWGSFIFRRQRAQFAPTSLWQDLEPVEWVLRKMSVGAFMQPATWLVSRELTEAATLWDTRLLTDDDGEYFARVVLASRRIRFVPGAAVYYRMQAASTLSYIGLSNSRLESQYLSMRLQIAHLRTVEDTPRVRAACLEFLQRELVHFHPVRPDLVEGLQVLAAQLGGHLELPRFHGHYAAIEAVAGPLVAKRAELGARRVKWSVLRWYDKAMFRLETAMATDARP
jgi:PST family polysaccharide transporter